MLQLEALIDGNAAVDAGASTDWSAETAEGPVHDWDSEFPVFVTRNISAPVGVGGVNHTADVRAIQELLNTFISFNRLPGRAVLTLDGKIGSNTINAIKHFQQIFVGMHNPDGKVDPGGRTLELLNKTVFQPAAAPTTSPSVPATSGTLRYGVPNGVIFSGYLKQRSSGYHTGIDVWPSGGGNKGATDPRRGAPVYATIRQTIEIATLNSVKVAKTKQPPWEHGLNLRGNGFATLREVRVRTDNVKNRTGSQYGGVVGLACRYTYSASDGTSKVITLFVEYWHLITLDYLPKRGNNSIIPLAEYQAAGKADRIGYGPKMKNGTILYPNEFTGNPPLVGYLGATQNPHVHIHAEYREGVHNYLFYQNSASRRLDPTAVIR